jgi:hypothetical protein
MIYFEARSIRRKVLCGIREDVQNSVSVKYPTRRLGVPQNKSTAGTMSNSSSGLAWSISWKAGMTLPSRIETFKIIAT